MSGQIAIAVFPFQRWFRACRAIPAALNFGCAVTSFAVLYNLMAKSIVVAAPFGGHESAFTTFTNGLTNHGNQPPFKY